MKQIKTGGRQKGTPNKLQSDLRENINEIILNEISNLKELLDAVPIDKRLDYIIKLLPYAIPKPLPIENYNLDAEKEIEVSDAEKEAVLNKFREMLRE